MDPDRFLTELSAQLEDTSRFAAILDAVPGLAKSNTLAVLNVAARCLAPGEWYVEVGTFRGTSLISALQGNEHARFAALDNWSLGGATREQLETNLERFKLAGKAELLEGDAFETLRSGALAGRAVGAYYYDNGHEYEQQLDGLRLVEPYLASPALLVVDDSDWERVARAVDDYVVAQPRAREIFRADGDDAGGSAEWWKGMRVLRWD
ncbi:MAG: class I SAM-dependent methyltransferase [Gaiellaceae bacterium]